MPSTWSQVFLHVVFATKHREPFIQPHIAERLYPFIGGIQRNHGGTLLTAGGMPDHVHLLVRLPTTISIADLLREIKATTSAWIKHEFEIEFAWQEGYGVFSASKSSVDTVSQYIRDQATHHERVDSRAELMSLLRKHGVEFEEKYLD